MASYRVQHTRWRFSPAIVLFGSFHFLTLRFAQPKGAFFMRLYTALLPRSPPIPRLIY